MNFVYIAIAIAALVFSPSITARDPDSYEPYNQSKCIDWVEQKRECDAIGGTYNWTYCTCE